MRAIHPKKYLGTFFKVLKTTKRSQVGIMTLKPGEDSGDEELHPGDQVVYLVDGSLEVTIAKKIVRMTKGSLCIIPPKTHHTLCNRGRTPAFLVSVYAPPAY